MLENQALNFFFLAAKDNWQDQNKTDINNLQKHSNYNMRELWMVKILNWTIALLTPYRLFQVLSVIEKSISIFNGTSKCFMFQVHFRCFLVEKI